MSNLLVNYLNKRMSGEDIPKKSSLVDAGPLITISREVGCNAVKLAKLIAARFNSQRMESNWRVVSKEVFFESAKELNMAPEQVKKTLNQSEKYIFEEVLKAFNDKNYKSEFTIGKTMRSVIHQIAADGFCIIVGRAGNIIAKDIKNALHIRLVATLDYRINTIMHNNNLNKEESIRFIKQVDKERNAFRNAILKDNPHTEMFDITFNRAVFTDEEMVDLVELAAAKKNLLQHV
jgi:cytidylate kinase